MTVLDERFAHWVQDVELESGSERFTALRQAAESLADGLTPAAAFDLAGYAVGHNSATAFEAVRAAVSQNDPRFAAAAVDLEPRLVASAALARTLEDHDDTAALVAEAVLSAEFAGLDSPVPELPELARATLGERFRGLRNRVEIPSARLEAIFDAPGPAGGDLQAAVLLGATRTLAEQLTSMLGALGQRFETRLDAADEELEVLWWTFAQQGTQNGSHWRDLDAAQVLLRSGLELADRHRFNAEIPTTREILRRVLGPLAAEQYSVAEVVSGCSSGSPATSLASPLGAPSRSPPASGFAPLAPDPDRQARPVAADPHELRRVPRVQAGRGGRVPGRAGLGDERRSLRGRSDDRPPRRRHRHTDPA